MKANQRSLTVTTNQHSDMAFPQYHIFNNLQNINSNLNIRQKTITLLINRIIRTQRSALAYNTTLHHVQENIWFLVNFCKCRPVFKILSLIDSQGNYVSVIQISTSTELCCYTTLWNFKIQNNRQPALLPEIFNLCFTQNSTNLRSSRYLCHKTSQVSLLT